MAAAADLPELPERQSWSTGLAPAYIGTFLWVAFFDGLGCRSLAVGGLVPSLGGVIAAAALGYLLLYRIPASWGFTAQRPLDGLAAATFGTRGAQLVPNLLIGLGQVGLFTVGIGYATDFILGGLLVGGLIEPRVVRPVPWGGTIVPSPVFLTTALGWGTVTALVGLKIVRWIAAIMRYFPVFPAIGLALTAAAAYSGLPDYRPVGVDPATGLVVATDLAARLAFLAAFQWTFAFTTLLGLSGADWGAASLSLADVRKGGWVGVALAPVVVASIALLAVAGNEGKLQQRAEPGVDPARPGAVDPGAKLAGPSGLVAPEAADAGGQFTFRAAIEGGLERRVAAGVLIIFGLASLAPACYAAHEFGRRFAQIAPGSSRLASTMVGVAAGWFLILGGWSERTNVVFAVLGALLAPVAGVVVAASTRSPDLSSIPASTRFNLAGLLGWLAGAVVGLLPLLGQAVGSRALTRVPVASLLAFLVAYLVARVAAGVGLSPSAVASSESS